MIIQNIWVNGNIDTSLKTNYLPKFHFPIIFIHFHLFVEKAYLNSKKTYYDTSENQYLFKPIQPINTNVYENRDPQFCSTESYNSSSSNLDSSSFGIDNLAQFNNNNIINNNNSINNESNNVNKSWLPSTENKSYAEQLWKNDISFDSRDTGEKDFNNDKPLPLSPTMDEEAKNSSRSESESSDEISLGEALATGLIPSHITPEIAARMNIELINQPKAVIESFYGHSPGEVYTIPEEEDEICSPTGADGVTSLRKQRMASGRSKFFGYRRNLSRICVPHQRD